MLAANLSSNMHTQAPCLRLDVRAPLLARTVPRRTSVVGKTTCLPPQFDKAPGLLSQQDMYDYALELARLERYDAAREAFEQLVHQHPTFCKAWVSYAQMERRMGRISDPLRLAVARQILQRGLSTNPGSGCLAQAWGLMELQKGNLLAAVRLLERSVVMDPFLSPVLRWKPVSAARSTLVGSSRYRPVRARGTATAAAGGVAPAGVSAAGGAAGASSGSGSSVCSSGGASGGVGSIAGGTGTGGSMSSM